MPVMLSPFLVLAAMVNGVLDLTLAFRSGGSLGSISGFAFFVDRLSFLSFFSSWWLCWICHLLPSLLGSQNSLCP
jgi:hypothetical protein